MSLVRLVPVIGGSHHGKSFPIRLKLKIFRTQSEDKKTVEEYAVTRTPDGKVFLVFRPESE